VCVPLVRISKGKTESTIVITTAAETVGVLYID
jgi:hypothetical protein